MKTHVHQGCGAEMSFLLQCKADGDPQVLSWIWEACSIQPRLPLCGGISPLLIQGGLSRRSRAAWSVSAGPRERRLASVWTALCQVSSPLRVSQHPDFSLLLAAATSVSLLSSRGWRITSWDKRFSHIFFYSPNSMSFLKKKIP